MDRGLAFDAPLTARAQAFVSRCAEQALRVGVAESCTGGLLAALLTEAPGASDVFDLGVVSYANSAKEQVLGVPAAVIAQAGAVSEPVARAMVAGVFARSRVDLGAAITGIAGPGGGSVEKPVGTVWIAAGRRDRTTLARQFQFGAIGRAEVRLRSVSAALEMLEQLF